MWYCLASIQFAASRLEEVHNGNLFPISKKRLWRRRKKKIYSLYLTNCTIQLVSFTTDKMTVCTSKKKEKDAKIGSNAWRPTKKKRNSGNADSHPLCTFKSQHKLRYRSDLRSAPWSMHVDGKQKLD